MPLTASSAAPAATRVLVVDTDADLGALTATWLRISGFDVRRVADGAQALQILAGETFDVVVVDLPLRPGIDTADVLDRARSRRPDCRTVVTSVLDIAGFPSADATLVKPFGRARLIAAVVAPADLPAPRRTDADAGVGAGRTAAAP